MRYFYECGGCDNYHPLGFVGDCREDKRRYNLDDFGNMVNPFNEGVKEFNFAIVEEDFQDPAIGTPEAGYHPGSVVDPRD